MSGTILVVEDDADILEVMQIALEDEGYRVLLENGPRAVQIARTQRPDLILLDHLLQGDSGETIGLALKADPATAAIPLVVMSGRTDIEEVAALVGAQGILRKPFSLSDLQRTVERWRPQSPPAT